MSRVLLVDDDPSQCLLMRNLLADLFEVDMAHNGYEALEKIKDYPPDMVITDLMMPEMGGMKLVETLYEHSPWLPVIVMTSFGSEEIAVRALKAGAASYVNKANVNRELVNLIDEVLGLGVERRIRHELIESLTRVESHFTLDNDTQMIRALVQYVQESMLQLQFCDESGSMRLGIVLCEALNNAIIHGNLEIDAGSDVDSLVAERRGESPYCDRRVNVMARITKDEVAFVVRDEGPGFDVRRVRSLQNLSEVDLTGGRGVLLIHALADEVYYNATGNQLTIIKRRNPATPSTASPESLQRQYAEPSDAKGLPRRGGLR